MIEFFDAVLLPTAALLSVGAVGYFCGLAGGKSGWDQMREERNAAKLEIEALEEQVEIARHRVLMLEYQTVYAARVWRGPVGRA